MSRQRAPRTALLLVAILGAQPGPLGAQHEASWTDLVTVEEREQKLFTKLDEAVAKGAADQVAIVMNELLRRSRDEKRNLFVPLGEDENQSAMSFRGFRHLTLNRLKEMPRALRRSIAQSQEATARGLVAKQAIETRSSEAALGELIELAPLAPQARAAAQRLAALAFERHDIVAATAYDRYIGAFHPDWQADWGELARRALCASYSGRTASARAIVRRLQKRAQARPDLLSQIALISSAVDHGGPALQAPPQAWTAPLRLLNATPSQQRLMPVTKKPTGAQRSTFTRNGRMMRIVNGRIVPISTAPKTRFQARVVGDDVYISNGLRLFHYSARDGALRGRLPLGLNYDPKITAPLDMETRVVAAGNLVLANLLLPQVAPELSRHRIRGGTPLPSGFGSLVIFDRSSHHKIVYWEGDLGPLQDRRERPRRVPDQLTRLMLDGHVVGPPAIGPRRVFMAMVAPRDELEIWVAAFGRGDRSRSDLGLGLTPLWATRVGSVPKPAATVTRAPQAPRLGLIPTVLIGEDRVYCDHGNASLTALNARDGLALWSIETLSRETERKKARAKPNKMIQRARGNDRSAPTRRASESLRLAPRAGLSDVLLCSPGAGETLKAYDSATGALLWSTRHFMTKAHRFVVCPGGVVVRYGGRELLALDSTSGKLLSRPVSERYTDHARLAANADVQHRGDLRGDILVLPIRASFVQRVRIDRDPETGFVRFEVTAPTRLLMTKQSGHVTLTDHGLVLATSDRILIYGCEKAP